MSNNKVKLPNHLQKRVKSITTPVLAPPAKILQYSQETSAQNSQDVPKLDFSSATQASTISYKSCYSAKKTPSSDDDDDDDEEG